MITFQYYVGYFQFLVESHDGVTNTLMNEFSSALGESGTELKKNDASCGVYSSVSSYHSVKLLGRRIGPSPGKIEKLKNN